jgi:prolyl oligopeptidase
LLRVDYDAGHGMGSTKTQRDEEQADEVAFLLWQLGVPDFQPGQTPVATLNEQLNKPIR